MKTFIGLAVATLSLLTGHGAFAQSTSDALVEFVGHGERPIITFAREHGMMRGVEERPLLYVFGDGRVRVDRPAYMIRPGLFEYRIERDGLAALIAALDNAGVMNVDVRALSAERDEAARARRRDTGERLASTDPTITQITVDFALYARAGETPSPLQRTLRYGDLQIDALNFPGVKALDALARAEKRLLALTDHPDMVRIAEAGR